MYSAPKIEAWIGRCEDILAAIGLIDGFVATTSEAKFVADRLALGTVAYQLIVIAEAAKALAPGLEERRPGVPWRHLSGMRNILAHEYGRVDPHMVWVVATQDLIALRTAIIAERDWLASL